VLSGACSQVSAGPKPARHVTISKQLDAIVEWTKDGRAPTIPERKRLVMGIQSFREYEMTDDDGLSEHRDRLGGLNTYVKHWPEDSAARDPNNDQYLFTPWYD